MSAARPQTVLVQPGDSLWRIARRHLGAGLRWPEIWQANRDAILAEQQRRRSARTGPDWIFPGTVLQLHQPPGGQSGP